MGEDPLLAHAADEEDLVVHREPEEHREHDDRDGHVDRAGPADPEDGRAPSPGEHRVHDPECGADREQVHHRCDCRDQQAAEHGHQEQERKDHDDRDEERQLRGEDRGDVVVCCGDPAD